MTSNNPVNLWDSLGLCPCPTEDESLDDFLDFWFDEYYGPEFGTDNFLANQPSWFAENIKNPLGNAWDVTKTFFGALNDPDVYSDYWGDAIYDKGHGTLQIGGSGTGGGSTGGTAGDGLAFSFDMATGKFEIGSYFMGGMGSYVGANGSFTLDLTVSHNRSIKDLAGESVAAGGSGSFIASFGAEANVPLGSNASPSFTVSGGAGGGATPGEGHVFIVKTYIVPLN